MKKKILKISLLLIIAGIFCISYFVFGPSNITEKYNFEDFKKKERFQNKIGVLLVHGFADSPDVMKLLGEYLAENFIDAHFVLLAGHGETLQKLRKTKCQDWYNSVKEKFDLLKSKYTSLIVIGFSTGANLALLLSIENKFDKMVLLSPAIEFKERWYIPLKIKTMIRMLKSIIPYVPKLKKGDIFKRENLKFRGFYYKKYPLDSLYQLVLLMEKVKKEAYKVTTPCLIIHSKDDGVVSYEGAKMIYNSINSKKKELISLKNVGHLIILDCKYEIVYRKIVSFIKKDEL